MERPKTLDEQFDSWIGEHPWVVAALASIAFEQLAIWSQG